MTYRGRVQGGVVVLHDGSPLPEGTAVTVLPDTGSQEKAGSPRAKSVWESMVELARWAESQPCSLPDDLATNHDHYLHGLPKRT